MAALANRMGQRWDRHEIHATTAADAGTEIDNLYHLGFQNEWSIRCVHCDGLFRPLWEDHSKEIYNGHKVYQFTDHQSDTMTLESLKLYCPHCDKNIETDPRTRAEMDEGADYVPVNPDANIMYQSYRWNAFALRWKNPRDLLAIYMKALYAAKLGDVTLYVDWVKKQEVRTNYNEFPMIGTSQKGRDYKMADIQDREGVIRPCAFDVQEGSDGEGFHLWGLVCEYEKDGKSRRIDYRKLTTWAAAREFQNDHKSLDKYVTADFGARDREVFGRCAEWKWYAMKSGDEDEFPHIVHRRLPNGQILKETIYYPWSEPRMENPMTGKTLPKEIRARIGQVPAGFCLSILWSKPRIYPIFYALKNGESGRYFGIAEDINEEFTKQLHSYIPAWDMDKKTNSIRKQIWKQIKKDDHAFVMGASNLVTAMRFGYYPMAKESELVIN